MNELFKNLPTLYAERIILRKINKNDLNKLFECLSNEHVTKYMFIDTNKTIYSTQKFLDTILSRYTEDKPSPWAIALKESNELIGMCGFSKYDYKNKKAEVGYLLSYNYWNKGIATEALDNVIKFGFENMKLNKIEARCINGNLASENVMIKNGMKLDGMLRKDKFHKGCYIDLKLYSILRCEKYNLEVI